jgi:hypothetical protein
MGSVYLSLAMHRHRPRLVKSLHLPLASYSTSAPAPPPYPARQPADRHAKRPLKTRPRHTSTSRGSSEEYDRTSRNDASETLPIDSERPWESFNQLVMAYSEKLAKGSSKSLHKEWKNASRSSAKKATSPELQGLLNPLNKLVDAASKKPLNGWQHSNEGRNTAQMRLRQALHRTNKSASPTKIAFEAAEDDPSGTSVLDEESRVGPELKPGTFVEVRRCVTSIRATGIVQN